MITESSRTRALRGLGIIFFIGIIIFMFLKFQAFIFGPHITDISIPEYLNIEESFLEVNGKVAYTETLTIQGRSITLDESGNFKEILVFPRGNTTLEFVLTDPFGKTKFYYFHIYADYPEIQASLEAVLPTLNEEEL